jgi:murein DD-endopeptidase MepM/ murein hydrolase activator NlpD
MGQMGQMGQLGQMANQMGQAGQMDQQTAGMFNQLCTMFKSLLSQFQQWMNGGQNAAGQNGQNNGANAVNNVNNNGQAVNQGKGYDGKAGLISGTNTNNSVYGPNGITMKPLDKYNVSSEFGNRPSMGDFHTGIDLAAPAGSPIRAMKGGTVTKVANDPKGYGNYVEIKHPDGSTTRYGHMSSFGNVKVGMQIGGGSVLGAVGSTGRSTGPHLHFEYRDANGTAIDPRKVMNF